MNNSEQKENMKKKKGSKKRWKKIWDSHYQVKWYYKRGKMISNIGQNRKKGESNL